MANLHAFDTLGYAKTLIDKGYDRDKAEALAEAQQKFLAKEVATESFVRDEIDKAVSKLENKIDKLENKVDSAVSRLDNKIDNAVARLDNKIDNAFAALDSKIDKVASGLNSKIERENALLENRLNKTNAKMLAFAVATILAGMPIVLALMQKFQ